MSLISKYFTKTVAQINEEFSKNDKAIYSGYALRSFDFMVDTDGNVAGRFMINATQVGEDKKTVGRTIYTNYYEFVFYFDEKGELELQDEE